MTNEERDIIAGFVARVGGAPAAPQTPPQTPWGGASVPATQDQPPPAALPPVDPEADKFIAEQFQQHPEARYRITQLAFVQEHALIEAQNRMKQLQWQLQQMAQQQQQSGARPGGGGFFSSLFGGGRSAAPAPPPTGGPWGQPGQGQPQYQQPQYQQPPPPRYAPPPPQYPPGSQAGALGAGGTGFLGSALRTAAGVAGGVLAADAIRDMFAPRQQFMGGGGFGGSPWGAPGADPSAGQGYVDQGQWDQGSNDPGAWNDPGQAAPDTGGGGWDPSGAGGDQGGGDQGGGWDQGGGDQGGGWDQGGGDPGGGSDDSLI